jgi:probable HAF family extracellular repeat protein
MQSSHSVLRNLTSMALTACCAIGVASSHAETYSLSDLGVIPGQKTNSVSLPAAINDKAQVAGICGPSAFRYTTAKAVMEDVSGNSANGTSRGFAINSSGQVVGDSTFDKNGTSRAAMFCNGSAIDLGALKYRPFSRANGINSFGQVVGSSSDTRDGDNSRAFIVNTASAASRSPMTDLGTLGGPYAQASAINDSGFATGNSRTSNDKSGSTHAFIWYAATRMLDLGTLDGDFSSGTSINAKGHVAGYSTINRVDERVHGFLFDGAKMLDLGSLGGASSGSDFSFALGVNVSDQVVGYSYLPSAQAPSTTAAPTGPWQVAFLYDHGVMVNLNDLIGSASGKYRLYSATAINDNGQIAAIAFDMSADAFHAVLLTPDSLRPVSR